MNKIVELKINPEVELLGFDAVALVEQPAIEENFYAFNNVDLTNLIFEEFLKQELFDETEDVYELEIGDYRTRHYDMCPGASALYGKIVSGEIQADMGLAIRAARLQDALFWLEKHTVKEMGSATYEDVVAAQNLVYEIMQLAKMMGLEQEHQYVYSHLQVIRELAGVTDPDFGLDVSGLPNFIDEIGKKKI